MFDFSGIYLDKLVVHHIGNPNENEQVRLSGRYVQPSEEVNQLLMSYFLSPFKKPASLYNFYHMAGLDRNEVFHYATEVFRDPDNFMETTKKLAHRLFEKSNHPKVKSGEFYLAYFKNCLFDEQNVDAIGLFKSENKDVYLKVYEQGNDFEINYEDGININKLDKGCLILNMERHGGYVVAIMDTVSGSGSEAQYWKDDFLKLKHREDEYYHTRNYLNAYRDFCDKAFEKDRKIERTEQVELLKKVEEYFNMTDFVKTEDLETSIFEDPGLRQSFRDHRTEFVIAHNLQPSNEFAISPEAVKERRKIFKHVLKLDKNFHVYIHGDTSRIEKGFDDSQNLNFYKIYFDKET